MKVLKSVWFKCVACLLIIAVISGALLASLNDLLFVTPEIRTARAIKKIYGKEMEYSVVLDIDSKDENTPKTAVEKGDGKINKIYSVVTDKGQETLVQATGYNGYKNGTVTVWVKGSINYIELKNGNGKQQFVIQKVLLESSDKQTLMSKLTATFYDNFILTDVTDAYKMGSLFSATDENLNFNPVTGATKSATAAVNAVNSVLLYFNIGD